MKNLFASMSYTFNNFYNNLNVHGQIVFSAIIILILILCILLFITYLVQGLKNKHRIKNLRENIKTEIVSHDFNKEQKSLPIKEDTLSYDTKKNDISDIAKRVEDAIKEERPIDLTNFEENQEREAIISIDELMKRAKELEIIEDDNTGINYLEKYNLEPSEIENAKKVINNDTKKEVKAFRVSQVISPVYGVKKEAIDSNSNN